MPHDPLKIFIRRTWSNINRRTINGNYPDWKNAGTRRYLLKGIRIEFSRDEFVLWVAARKNVISRMWNAGERPSIDRLDRTKHYALNNIRLTTIRRNRLEGSNVQRQLAKRRMLRNRRCLGCGNLLQPHIGEAITRFNVRKSCNIDCMYRAISAKKIIRGRGYAKQQRR